MLCFTAEERGSNNSKWHNIIQLFVLLADRHGSQLNMILYMGGTVANILYCELSCTVIISTLIFIFVDILNDVHVPPSHRKLSTSHHAWVSLRLLCYHASMSTRQCLLLTLPQFDQTDFFFVRTTRLICSVYCFVGSVKGENYSW